MTGGLRTSLVSVEYLVTGFGEPTNLSVHCLAGFILTTRSFCSAMRRHRAVFHFRGLRCVSLPKDYCGYMPPWLPSLSMSARHGYLESPMSTSILRQLLTQGQFALRGGHVSYLRAEHTATGCGGETADADG